MSRRGSPWPRFLWCSSTSRAILRDGMWLSANLLVHTAWAMRYYLLSRRARWPPIWGSWRGARRRIPPQAAAARPLLLHLQLWRLQAALLHLRMSLEQREVPPPPPSLRRARLRRARPPERGVEATEGKDATRSSTPGIAAAAPAGLYDDDDARLMKLLGVTRRRVLLVLHDFL